MNSRSILGSAALVAGTAILSIGLQVFAAPSTTPPGGNAYAPLNTGPYDQVKIAGSAAGQQGKVQINGIVNIMNQNAANIGLYVQNGRVQIGDPSAYTVTGTVGLMLVNKQLRIIDGQQAAGRVLTSDKDGLATWKDQGDAGKVKGGVALGGNGTHTASFAVPFADTNYTVVLGAVDGNETGSSQCKAPYLGTKSVGSFTILTNDNCAQVHYSWIAVHD